VTFNDLNLSPPLINALNDIDFVMPTPIQKEAFPVIMSGKDLVGIAQTGTGKTIAYLLPILRQLKYSDDKHPRVLIVVPTRELVKQVLGELQKLSKYITVRVEGVYGGANIKTQKQLVYNGIDILIATPGRLVDLALSGVLRLKMVQKLVIDEVDEMLNLGFRQQLIDLMDSLPPKRQNLMFSATLTEDVKKLIDEYFYNPLKIEITEHGTPIEKIIQKVYHVPNFYTKVNLLEYILANDLEMQKVLVFVDNKKLADRLFEQINAKFPEQIGVIHSNKSQNQRFNSLKRFQEEALRVLIATDLISRGIDVDNVTHVVNFDTPELPEDYIHRIGRTGRADKGGISITFVNEAELEFQMRIEKMMKKAISLEPLPQNLKISDIYTDEEKPKLFDKDYLKKTSNTDSKGAFHEKKDKNKKVNLGGPSKKMKKYKKPFTTRGKKK